MSADFWRLVMTSTGLFLVICLALFLADRVSYRQKLKIYTNAKREAEEGLPVRISEDMLIAKEYDATTEGLIVPLELAACIVYRHHSQLNPTAINHLCFIIFSACESGKIKSYDTETLFPSAKYLGVASKFGKSSAFLGQVPRNHIGTTSVNLLEVMEWLSSEGFIFCRATMNELQKRSAPSAESPVSKLETSGADEAPLSSRERAALLRLVGGLLELLQDNRPSKADTSNPTKIIDALVANYGDSDGISARNLQKRFAEAKRVLESG
jgi:hypothetical protein